MVKLVGSLFILAGGGLLWYLRMQAWQRRQTVLLDLVSALRGMGEEIRMTRTPMPHLLQGLAERCGEEVQAFFRSVAAAAEGGDSLADAWKQGAAERPLGDRERGTLLGLELRGDEEALCKAISQTAFQLAQYAGELERKHPEEMKRTSALCFSSAALLVILLI